jgi:hypothetical protein
LEGVVQAVSTSLHLGARIDPEERQADDLKKRLSATLAMAAIGFREISGCAGVHNPLEFNFKLGVLRGVENWNFETQSVVEDASLETSLSYSNVA